MDNEEKAAAEKQAIASMKAAMANMEKALSRISALEKALGRAAENLEWAASLIPTTSFGYRSEQRHSDQVKEQASEARKAL